MDIPATVSRKASAASVANGPILVQARRCCRFLFPPSRILKQAKARKQFYLPGASDCPAITACRCAFSRLSTPGASSLRCLPEAGLAKPCRDILKRLPGLPDVHVDPNAQDRGQFQDYPQLLGVVRGTSGVVASLVSDCVSLIQELPQALSGDAALPYNAESYTSPLWSNAQLFEFRCVINAQQSQFPRSGRCEFERASHRCGEDVQEGRCRPEQHDRHWHHPSRLGVSYAAGSFWQVEGEGDDS